MEELQFRSATFGGFHRQDVLDYVEHLAGDHKSKLEALEQALAKAEGDMVEMRAQAAQALEDKERDLESMSAEKQALQERLNEVEPLAASYNSIREKAASIEMDGHERSSAIVKQAEEEAEALRTQVNAEVEGKRSEAESYARNTISEADAYADLRMKNADELVGRRIEEANRRLTAMRTAYDDARAALNRSLESSQQVVAAVQESLSGIGEDFSAVDALLLAAESADGESGAGE